MNTYTPTATWHSDVRHIEDGDAPTEANFVTSVEDLADNAAYLKAHGLIKVYNANYDDTTPSTLQAFTDHTAYDTIDTSCRVNVTDCLAGDILMVNCSYVYEFADASDIARVRFVALDNLSSATAITGTNAYIDHNSGSGEYFPASLCGMWTVVTPGTTSIRFQAKVAASGDVFRIQGHFSVNVLHYRTP